MRITKNVRVQIRHIGQRRLIFRIQKNSSWNLGDGQVWNNWGYNLYFGRLFLAIRRPSKYASKALFNLKFGRSQISRKGWS